LCVNKNNSNDFVIFFLVCCGLDITNYNIPYFIGTLETFRILLFTHINLLSTPFFFEIFLLQKE